MRAVFVASLLMLLARTGFTQTRPLELLPGEEWMHVRRPGLLFAVARPLAGMQPVESWSEGRLNLPVSAQLRLRLRSLRAGLVRSNAIRLALHWRGPWFEADAATSIERVEIRTLGRETRRGGGLGLVFVYGPARLGVRLELPPSRHAIPSLWHHAIQLRRGSFALGLQRHSARYELRGIWSAAASLRLHESFELGFLRRDAELLLQLRARRADYALHLSAPLASLHGGGVAAGMSWSP